MDYTAALLFLKYRLLKGREVEAKEENLLFYITPITRHSAQNKARPAVPDDNPGKL